MKTDNTEVLEKTHTYPSTSESIDPAFVVDPRQLLHSLHLNGILPDPIFVELWIESITNRSNNMSFKDDYNNALASTLFNISMHFRIQAAHNEEHEQLYLAWGRLAVDLNHADACINLVKYANGFQHSKKVLEHWSNKSVELIFENFDRYISPHKADDYIQKIHEILSIVSARLPAFSLNNALRLLAIMKEAKISTHLEEVKSTAGYLLDKNPGLVVLESISPSEDRTVRSTLKRFEGLMLTPTPLAQIVSDVHNIKKVLDEKFPWFENLTEKITKMMLVRQLGSGDFYLPPMILLGPPGIGKTYYVKTLCELINVPHRVISMAGKSDNRDLVGTARGWSGGHPSMPVTLIQEHQIANPVVVLDELEKCGGSDQNGRALDTLLTLFENTSAQRIFDEYLCGNINLAHISWIATGNDVKQLPAPLLSRLEVITIDKPHKSHYPQIVKASMQSFCQRNGIHVSYLPVLAEADWESLEKHYDSPRQAKRAAEHWLTNRLLNANVGELN